MGAPWWQRTVIYQVYPRSFADANGDGIGDLPGLVSRLDHLAWLGVDAIWLSPTFPSPNADWGYDISDYLDVHPDLGTLADMDSVLVEADRRGLRVLLDLVPNHTSDTHPWFRDPSRRDWYVWADPGPGGGPPNNWASAFGGPAWTRDPGTGRYYLHTFLPAQPDLDWRNEEVRDAFDGILRFWFERGVAGFRIDVAHGLVKDRLLRNNPPAEPGDPPSWLRLGQRPLYNLGRPEAVDVHRRWRRIAAAYEPERLLLGETYLATVESLLPYLVPDGLHLCMNFAFARASFVAEELARAVARTETLLPAWATPVWHASNHDDGRLASRWCDGDEDGARCALVALLSLRGASILYQGDEIALENVPVPTNRVRDLAGRDPGRTPMVWSDSEGGGFTAPDVQPWLPIGARDRNVAAQRDDPGSTLNLVRDLIALRRRPPLTGAYEPVDAPAGVWAFRRGGGALVALNLGDRVAHLDGVEGSILLATDRSRDGEQLHGALELRPREAAIVGPPGGLRTRETPTESRRVDMSGRLLLRRVRAQPGEGQGEDPHPVRGDERGRRDGRRPERGAVAGDRQQRVPEEQETGDAPRRSEREPARERADPVDAAGEASERDSNRRAVHD
jgi:alpha-glucosidase